MNCANVMEESLYGKVKLLLIYIVLNNQHQVG